MSSFHPSRKCTGSSVWQTNVRQNDFVYDGKLRRRVEKDFTWNAGTASWLQTNEVHFVYDGNLVVQERNANNLPTVTYTRGTDLSGSFQGAGGIGGLLARTDNAKLLVADPNTSAYYHCDGNGNVTCLINAYQQIAGKYLYDPYGNTLAMYGSLADANTYRFSSKEWNGNSGLYYYLYRFYDPNFQRWLTRDPLGAQGFEVIRLHAANPFQPLVKPGEFFKGANLCNFVDSDPIDGRDPLGLFSTFYKCPNSAIVVGKGSIYTCSIVASSGQIGAGTLWLFACLDPQLLKCLAQAVGVMNLGCAISGYATFSLGCDMAAKCVMTGGQSALPIPPGPGTPIP